MSSKEISDEEIITDIFHKLHRKKKWGASHTAFINLYKWCDPRYAKKYREIARRLIRKGFIISKPTVYGEQVSLNPRKREEIISIIRKWFKDIL
jgi:hypothetical protein